MMQFENYIREGIVRVIKKDKQRAYSLIIEAERKLSSLNEKIEKIGIRNDNANDYLEYSYGIIMFLIRAKLFLDGYSCSGQGAHEAEVSFMANLGFSEKEINFTDKLRYCQKLARTTSDTLVACSLTSFARRARHLAGIA